MPTRTDQELTTLVRQGLPASGMPSFANLSDADAASLIQFLRTLKPRAGSAPEHATVTVGAATIGGLVLNQSQFDMQILGRNTPTIVNTAFNSIQMWDGRKKDLEDQATGPISAGGEMNMPLPEMVALGRRR